MQSTNSIMMIRPAAFGYDEGTAGSNAFQSKSSLGEEALQDAVVAEFEAVVRALRDNGVDLYIIDDTPTPQKRDAVFPNNWISTHDDGTVILYPMLSEARRPERRKEILDELERYFEIRRVVDLTRHEQSGRYLEGTGSMVFDRTNGVIYACRSPRTNESVLRQVAKTLNYRSVVFDALDARRKPIYHTNVMMSIGTNFAVLADFTIADRMERERLSAALIGGGHRTIKLRPEQLGQMAANVLEIQGRERILAMSAQAHDSLSDSQRDLIELWAKRVHAPIGTIEQVGGGSMRCMLAEIFLPRK